jgi:RNA polymerase sigma-70 factor (ECF subfamily)
MDEQQAILCLKHGDIGGLEFLVGLYQVRAVRTAYLITCDPQLAEDVVQEAFLQVYRSIRYFDQDRPFSPWFLRSVVNAALKAAKKDSRHSSFNTSGKSFEEMISEGASVQEQVEINEFQGEVWAAMQNLNPRERAVVVQRYFLDMSETEMAAELETPPGTVKWLLHQARERLRSLLSERTSK